MHRFRYFVRSAGDTRGGKLDLGSFSVEVQDRGSDRPGCCILPAYPLGGLRSEVEVGVGKIIARPRKAGVFELPAGTNLTAKIVEILVIIRNMMKSKYHSTMQRKMCTKRHPKRPKKNSHHVVSHASRIFQSISVDGQRADSAVLQDFE